MRVTRRRVQGLVLFAVLAGCAQIPQITFQGNPNGRDGGTMSSPPIQALDAGSGETGTETVDATVTPPTDGGVAGPDASLRNDAAPDDAGSEADSNPSDQPGDDGGEAGATILCGSTLVSSCAGCDAGFLRCKANKVDQCVSDCSACAGGRYACIHCPSAKALPRGTCLALGADGEIDACNEVNLCPCTEDTDCPSAPHAPQTCQVVDSGKMRCMTCGMPTTEGLACVAPEQDAGVCRIMSGAPPVCGN